MTVNPSSSVFLIYISRAAQQFEDSDLVSIAAKASEKNTKLDITGLLLKAGNHFIQILEGTTENVKNLLSTIRKDPRHTDVRTIYEEPMKERRFGQWSMKYLPLTGTFNIGTDELLKLRKNAEQFMENGEGIVPIVSFIKGLTQYFAEHKVVESK